MVIGGPSQVLDDVDIQIHDIRIDQIQSMKYLGIHISITNFPWIFSVTSYVPMLQAKYRCYTELDNFIGQVHINLFTKNPACFWLCLFCVGSYKTRQHLKITTDPKLRGQNCYGKIWLHQFQKCWSIIWAQLGISQRKMWLFHIGNDVQSYKWTYNSHIWQIR